MGKSTICEIAFHKAHTLEDITKKFQPVPELISKMDELCEIVNTAKSTVIINYSR